MRRESIGAMTVAVWAVLAGGQAAAEPAFSAVREWRAPFPGWSVAQIAASGGDLFYVTVDAEMHLGRLDVDRNRFTEWALPYATTSPGDIRVRARDGAVFVTSAVTGEIGQFDPPTQTLRRWKLPVPETEAFEGPWSLAFDDGDGVFFSAADMGGPATVIGRLDTTTGNVSTWRVPEWLASVGAARLTYVNGSVFFNIGGTFNVFGLELATGAFTAWPMSAQPAWDIASDSAGNVYFQALSSVAAIARLVPSSGRLTEWAFPGQFNDAIALEAERVLVGGFDPSGLAVLDPARAGVESVISGTSGGVVVPVSSVVVPTVSMPARRQAAARMSYRLARRTTAGDFDLWPIGGQPRYLSPAPGAVFFTRTNDAGASVIGRLAR